MNEDIKYPKLRVISEEGPLGIITREEALKIAEEKGLDLILLTEKGDPPVCKIIDLGKLRYEKEKQKKIAKKKQKNIQMKEMRVKPKIGIHDLEFKIKHIREFLIAEHKVKVFMPMFGRQSSNMEFVNKIMDTIVEKTKDVSLLERSSARTGNTIILILAPLKKGK